MTTKFFRKNAFPSPWGRVREGLAFLFLLLWPFVLSAQNGVSVSNLAVESGTVTFSIHWEKANMPELWSDTVWVFVDHNVDGTMVRLPLVGGSTLTGTTALGVGQVKDELDSGNDQGVWVIGNARGANIFSATVTLLTSNQNVSGACVYASNYPPVGTFLSASTVSFTGTQPFNLVLQEISGSGTISGSSTDGYYYMPVGYELKSFTDKTGAPGRWSCLPMTGGIDFSMQPASIAKGQPATFTATNHPSEPNAADVTYTWGAPGFDPASFSGAYNAPYRATAPSVAGPTTVTLTARSTNYCDRELKKSVTVLDCYPSDVYTLTASATDYCAGTTVTFALSNTTSGRTYRLYNGVTPVMDELIGTGSAATFTGAFAGGGVYTAQMLAAGGHCAAVMTGSPVVTERNLPTAPTISATDVCLNGGDLVFTALGHSGVVEWVSDGGGTANGNSVTFESGAATGTKTVRARSAQTYTSSTLTCYSAEVPKSANVNPLPTVASFTGNSRCGTGTVALMASSSGAVIDWYAAASDGTPLVSGNNTYTTPSIDASTTYYAQARIVATGCVSSVRTAVLATINTVPDAPAMGGGGSQCGGTMSITATAGSNGTGIRWTDGNSTISPRSVGSGTYYAVTTSSAGCESGAASVAVTIHVVPTIARSGGAASQSVNQNSAISAITYTASNATSIVRGGSLPAGVTGSISGTTLTIRGTPSATGTFGYTVSGSHTNGCVSTISTGTITVAAAASNFYSTNTWSYGGLTWSDRVVASPSNCSKVTSLTTSNNTTADYKVDKSTGVDRYYYSWTCATGGTSGNTNAQLCPTGWRLPTRSDYSTLVSNTGYGTLISQWGYGGTAEGGTMYDQTSEAYYWASTAYTNSENYAYHLYYYSGGSSVLGTIKQLGLQVRCVK